MEEILKSIILGIIQGLTEFLPVSSSGHIELGKVILNLQFKDNLLFSIVVHAATALSTVVIFRKRIVEILRGLLTFNFQNESFRFSIMIILSMIPAAIVGVLFKDELEALFGGNILLVGSLLLLTGTILLLANNAKQTTEDNSYFKSIILGIAQAIAILPGISRSGATIGTALLLKIDRQKAAEFSFIMVLPLILGATLLDVKDYMEEGAELQVQTATLAAGFIAAFISGLFACKWMIAIVKRAKLSYFAYYCFAVGAIGVIYSLVA